MKIISSGVTAPKGFQAAGLRAGIKAGKTNKDMALIYSEAPAVCAGTFTRNIVKAAPVLWDKKIVEEEGRAQTVVINSGIANACTGEEGMGYCQETAQAALDGEQAEEVRALRNLFKKDPVKRMNGAVGLVGRWKQEYRKMV